MAKAGIIYDVFAHRAKARSKKRMRYFAPTIAPTIAPTFKSGDGLNRKITNLALAINRTIKKSKICHL